MRILVTNDDGIDAVGLGIAENIAKSISDDVWTVAPMHDQSGQGHAITISTPLRMKQLSERRFAVSGTPADCVAMGLHQILPELPDLIISGVNAGKNVGDDVGYSGTIGAVEEGILNGIRGIALSQCYQWHESEKVIPWEVARTHGPKLIEKLAHLEMPTATFLNVNFPNCQAHEVVSTQATRQGRTQYDDSISRRADGRGQDYYWLVFGHAGLPAPEGTDRYALENRQISVTPLKIDRTNHDVLEQLHLKL